MSEPRRSSRSTKGKHSQREAELEALLRDESSDEDVTKKRHFEIADDDEYSDKKEKKLRIDDDLTDDEVVQLDENDERPVEKKSVKVKKEKETVIAGNGDGTNGTNEAGTSADIAFKNLKDKVRINVAKALWNVLKQQLPDDISSDVSKSDIALEWSLEMEAAIYKLYPTKDRHYTDKSRSTMTILKKASVLNRLVDKSLTAQHLIRLSPQEIDEDLKKYADKVKQDSIKRLVLTSEDSGQRIRRTHKGEEIVDDVSDLHKYEAQDVNIVSKSVDHRRFEEEQEQGSDSVDNSLDPSIETPLTDHKDSQFNYNTAVLDEDAYESDSSESGGGMPRYDSSDDDDFDKILDKNVSSDVTGSSGSEKDKMAAKEKMATKERMAAKSKVTETTESTESRSSRTSPVAKASSSGPLPGLPPKPTFVRPLKSAMKKPDKLPPMLPKQIWQGPLTYPDLAFFNCTLEFVTHSSYYGPKTPLDVKLHNRAVNISKDLFSKPNYYVKGKLPFPTADKYLTQVSSASPVTKDFYVFKVVPLDNFQQYDKLNQFLGSQYKAGVLSAEPSFVKATYLISLNEQNVPPYLRQLKEFSDQNGLFVVSVVDKEYTPTNTFNPSDPRKPSVSIDLPEEPMEHHMQVPQHLRSEPYPKHPTESVLDSILSKLSSSDSAPPIQPYQQQPAAPQMTNEQLSLLSSIVQQNPQAQNNPSDLMNILQQQRHNGY